MVSRALRREFVAGGATPIVLGAARAPTGGTGLLGGLLAGRKYYRGSLRRIEPAAVPLPVILDGQRKTVPAIHVKGPVSVGADTGEAELWILDDEKFPLILRWEALGSGVRVVRIDNPPASRAGQPGAGGGIEIGDALSRGSCHAELHGIYFATGSARLLPESGAALERIAAVLGAHPDWSVAVEGHTDNIGDADSNLTLSRDRANAVRDALVANHRIAVSRLTATGFGLTRPVETNATIEGRARNRRVELSRKCK
jgi:outer membrane protein OmpA-like peptidoglycan-associated protein